MSPALYLWFNTHSGFKVHLWAQRWQRLMQPHAQPPEIVARWPRSRPRSVVDIESPATPGVSGWPAPPAPPNLLHPAPLSTLDLCAPAIDKQYPVQYIKLHLIARMTRCQQADRMISFSISSCRSPDVIYQPWQVACNSMHPSFYMNPAQDATCSTTAKFCCHKSFSALKMVSACWLSCRRSCAMRSAKGTRSAGQHIITLHLYNAPVGCMSRSLAWLLHCCICVSRRGRGGWARSVFKA